MEALHQPGDIIAERYQIIDTLGQGGVGITYAAQDLKNGQKVALKVLSLRQMGDWKVLELFEREAKVLAQLNHPAIPQYLDYFQVDAPEDRAFYIVQQLAEGKSLADLTKIGWRTNEDGVRKIASQILEILIYLHSLKPPVVHRDIKPQNLIWGKDSKIFLVDFGAVQDTYRSTLAKGSTIVGTYGYMAPEQFRGQAVPATDLYGLGATVLFLLTHRSPSDLPQERLKISFRSRIQVSSGFADWLEKMLEPDVEERFGSAKEALAALQGRMVAAKPRLSVSWKVLAGVGVAAVVAVSVFNSYKWTVLGAIGLNPSGICEAASSGNIEAVKDYLKQGGNPAKDVENGTSIMQCLLETKNGTKELAELVIAKLPNINTKYEQGQTVLHWAGSREVAKLLIAKGADVNAKDNQGNTPLHSANSKEVKEVAELLIAKGADVNAKDNQGNTPLDRLFEYKSRSWFSSPSQNQMALVKLLIAKGADVNAKNNQGKTPLQLALEQKSTDVAAVLIVKGAQYNAKDLNAKDNQGNTLLHWAAVKGSLKMAELLLAKGAQIDTLDKQGCTSLHWAAVEDRKEVAELLLTKGAQSEAKDKQGWTPLHWAALKGSKNVAEFLLTKGAQVEAKDNEGRSPLQWAASSGSKAVVELLIAKGAQVDARTKRGSTPLQVAAAEGHEDVAKLLIAKGAQVNAQRYDTGMTPLHRAAVEGHSKVGELLISKGAKVNARDNEGKTSLSWALKKGDKRMIALLKSHGGTE